MLAGTEQAGQENVEFPSSPPAMAESSAGSVLPGKEPVQGFYVSEPNAPTGFLPA